MLTLPLNTDLALTKSAKKKNSTFVLTLVAAAVLSGFSATSMATLPRHADFSKAEAINTINRSEDFTSGSFVSSETTRGGQKLDASMGENTPIHGSVLVRVQGSDAGRVDVSASNLNLSHTISRLPGENGENYSLAGGTIYVGDLGSLTLSGTNTIALNVENGRTYTDGGAFNAAIEASSLTIDGGTTTVTASDDSAGSPSLAGIGVTGNLHLTNNASLVVNVSTVAVADPDSLLVSQGNDYYPYEMKAEGIVLLEGATIRTEAGTTLEVDVKSTAENSKAALTYALIVSEGSVFDGTTIAKASDNGSSSLGIEVEGSSSFNGKTIVEVSSKGREALGIRLETRDGESPATINFGELDVTSVSSKGASYGTQIEDNVTANFTENTVISASDTNPNNSGDTIGMAMEGRATANFTGKDITIRSESASNVYPVEESWPQTTSGIELFGPGVITSAAETNLTISAVSTGDGSVLEGGQNEDADPNNFAGFVFGLGTEGGTIDLKGNTTISATGKGAYAVGMKLQAVAGDDDWIKENIPVEDFSLNATFGGDLTVTATSETGGAEAIRLGGFVPGSDGYGFEQYPEGVTVTMNTSATGVTTISASTGAEGFESVGVNFAYPDPEGDVIIDTPEEFTTGRGYLNLNGTTIITATHALKGDVGYVNNKGDLTLNGRVDQFKGEFTQTAGSTTLNDSRFFGGRTTIEGGKFTGQATVWNSDETSSLTVSNASISLHTFKVGQNHELSLSNATVTANYFNLNDQAKLDVGGSSFVLNGTDDEDSRIGGTMTGIKDITVNGGTLDLVEDARLEFVDGGKMTFNNGAMFSVAGNVSGGDLIFNDGTYLYEARPENEKELRIESGNVTFNGNVALLTGVSEDGSDMTLDNADRMTSLAIGPNNSSDGEPDPNVVFNGGSYTFETASVHAGALTFTGDAGNVDLGTLTITAGVTNVSGGNVYADKIDVSASGKLAVNGGSLHTYTDQIFKEGVGKDGQTVNPKGVKSGIELSKGTVAFEDQLYNEFYKNNAISLAKDGVSVVFNGQRVGLSGGSISIDDVGDQEGVVESQVDVSIDDSNGADASIGNSFGVSGIKVDSGVKSVTIGGDTDGATVTLVGGTDEQGNLKEVIDFADEGGSVKIDNKGTLALGKDGSVNNEGKLSSAVTVGDSGTLAVNSGTFTVSNATVEAGGTVAVAGGKATFENVVSKGGAIDGAGGSTFIENIDLETGSTTTITGSVSIDEIVDKASNGTINVGTLGDQEAPGKAGDLTITGEKLNGTTFFLDPIYVDGQGVEDASSLKFAGKTIDGKVIVGENSYAVFGSTNDSAFLDVFNQGDLSWGNKDGDVLAAAFVAAPITINSTLGGLRVDGTQRAASDIANGTVYFAKNSALVADVSEITDSNTALITADNGVTVEVGSKAVIVGDIKQSIDYKLTNDQEQNQNWADNLIAGNAMWKLEMTNGVINASLQDAVKVYGDAMQGSALANAGMQASGAEYDYVNQLLTDASGDISVLSSVAARFDAAMNPAGALTAFTTAYDRASDLRRIVREESVKGEGNRLWAQVTGGKTKLDGISSGAQSIKTDTNVYGLAIGGEAQFTNFMLGAAITAGTGKTENDAVDGTNDFEYYGFSLYGKTSVAGFDLLGDVSATWLKSDFTIGGAADVDTDTTTAVYSFGVQGEKKFEMSWADFTPFIGVDVYHVRSDGFDNGHGAKIDDSDATAVEIPIGARLSKSLETTGGFHMEPSFMLAVVPTIADTEIDSKVRFAGAESTYNFTFADDVKIRSNIGLDAVKDNFTFGLRAGYEWGDEERSAMNLQLRAKYAF